MRSQTRFVGILGLALCVASSCYGAAVSGTVKGQDGAPIEGAFVQAQNTKTKISLYVLTDHQGHYSVEKLPAGDYRVQVRATGFRAEPKSGVTLTADQNFAADFSMQPGPVRWNELSIYQAKKLWPEDHAKQIIFTQAALSATGFKRAWLL